MLTCFVIQPFDSGKFDKRFEDVYKPAIEAAGLQAYRVDQDPRVGVPIEAIEEGIRSAAVCLADITTDNPNVWYELGFAFAAGRSVVMVCSEERTGKKYPFDIQHRRIIPYLADSPSDFDKLRTTLTARLKALIEKGETLRQIAETEQVAPVEGLSQPELMVLATVAGSVSLPEGSVSLYVVKRDVEQAGLTNIGFALGVRRLKAKSFIYISTETDRDGDPYELVGVTEDGWAWIEANESLFLIRRPKKGSEKDDVPF